MKNISKRPVSSWEEVNKELEIIRGLLQKLDIIYGYGLPENVEAAKKGSIYINLDGGASTTMYLKESDDKLVTGWRAV